MLTRVDRIRRKIGLVCISGSGLMVIWGFTALKAHLAGLSYLIYWMVCLLLVTAAIYLALWDYWVMHKREREKGIAKPREKALKQDESTGS